jgi:hypothetical protein
MTFEGQYLTYAEYQDLGGSAIGDMPFNLLEFEARRKIDENTFNRLKDVEEIPQEVKLCEFNMINSINNYTQSINQSAGNGNIKSENTDGYSVSYGTASEISDIVKSKDDELKDIIRTYLVGVIVDGEHIMYCGVD